MNNWKLMSLISRMDAKEKKEFERWYAYELKGRKTHPWNLFQLVKKEGREFDSYEAMGKALEKRTNATASKIRGYSSQLCKQIELFLSIEALRRDEYQQKVYLLNHYQQTHNNKAFARTCTEEKEKLENQAALDADGYARLLELEELNYNQAPHSSKLQRVNDLFDLEWTLRKLEIACINFSYKDIHGFISESFALAEVIELLPNWSAGEESFWHRMYWEIYTLFTNPEKTDIQDILTQMKDNSPNLELSSLKNPYILLLNYQIDIHNLGGADQAGQNLLYIYEWGLKYGVLFNNQQLTWRHYKNLVTLPLQLEKYQLSLRYLESLVKHLNSKEYEEAYRYCQGVYHYYTGNFRKALKLWSEKKFHKLFYEIHTRFYSWEIMYESQKNRHNNPLETERLKGEINKLESYIQRLPNISQSKKQSFFNRVEMYRSLFKVNTHKDIDQFLKTIQDMERLTNRKWLLTMIELRKQELS